MSVNYDFTKAWSLGGRLVAQAGKTSGFLGLRRTGHAGTDYYFIFGSPDPAEKSEPMLTVKVVKPF